MFVAALSHEFTEAAGETGDQFKPETSGELARRILQDPRFSPLTQAEAGARKWSASVVLGGM